jgi:hypothetical protein
MQTDVLDFIVPPLGYGGRFDQITWETQWGYPLSGSNLVLINLIVKNNRVSLSSLF